METIGLSRCTGHFKVKFKFIISFGLPFFINMRNQVILFFIGLLVYGVNWCILRMIYSGDCFLGLINILLFPILFFIIGKLELRVKS